VATCTIPGTVTCCFTAREKVVKLYVDEIDVTGSIAGDLEDVNSAKTITFDEPTSFRSSFAIMGEERQPGLTGSVMAQCVSDREDSPWNNLKMSSVPGNWGAVWVQTDQSVAPQWFRNNFRVTLPTAASSGADDTSYTLNTAVCGAVVSTDKIKGVQSIHKPYFAVRQFVLNTNTAAFCPTRRRRLVKAKTTLETIEALKLKYAELDVYHMGILAARKN
jgi:hypothetical protein